MFVAKLNFLICSMWLNWQQHVAPKNICGKIELSDQEHPNPDCNPHRGQFRWDRRAIAGIGFSELWSDNKDTWPTECRRHGLGSTKSMC